MTAKAPEHFLIVGAGGIGAYYGARLQAAGHRVSFVARGAHLRAMQDGGLGVEHAEFHFQSAVKALSVEQLLATTRADEFSLIILAVKAGATRSLLDRLRDWLGDETGPPILSLQNGIDNERTIAATVGTARTIGGLAVRIGGHVVGPGRIEAKGPAQVILGAWPTARLNGNRQGALPSLVDTFSAAGIPTQLSEDIRLELWKKLLINNGVNPLSALTGLDTRTLSNHPQLGDSVFRLMQEAAQAARSDGVELDADDIDAMFKLIRTFEPIKTSMLVDYEKDRPLELDEITGAVCERCRAIQQPAPVSDVVYALLKLRLGQT